MNKVTVNNYTYNKNNNLISKTDPNGTTTTNTYDDLDRLISKSIITGSGVSGVTSENYSYDALGRLIEANDSNNHTLSILIPSNSRYAVSADVEKLESRDFYDLYGENVHTTHTYYINEEQKLNIQSFINDTISKNYNKYNLLGTNCSTFVQACLYIGGLDGGIDKTNLLDGIPTIYNRTLLNKH